MKNLPVNYCLHSFIHFEDLYSASSRHYYFVNVSPTLASEITESEISFHKFLDDPCSSSFVIGMTSPQEIVEISKQLRSSHSSGIDNIKPHIAKDTIQAVAPLLSEIVNCSFRNGVVPTGIKVAKIIPFLFSNMALKIKLTTIDLFQFSHTSPNILKNYCI